MPDGPAPRPRPLAALALALALLAPAPAPARDGGPRPPAQALEALVERVCGPGARGAIEVEVDTALAGPGGREAFVISARGGRPLVAGSTLSAATAGLGWYLSHHALRPVSWQRPRLSLSPADLPAPPGEERHEADVPLRYCLNYCAHSYSMAFWDWERWERELDWMALRGVNLVLVTEGADWAWEQALAELGAPEDEARGFAAGPAFQAWWLMGNLSGWGGPVPGWWAQGRRGLARRMALRMAELGMEPVPPGYSGLFPRGLARRLGWEWADTGTWCGFPRPATLLPGTEGFARAAAAYYRALAQVWGQARYYSIDPLHEGGLPGGLDLPGLYSALWQALDQASPGAVWVAQGWNENPRPEALAQAPQGRLLVLDLFAEARPGWPGGYGGHPFVYCMLHNFGGRTGIFGRLRGTMLGWRQALAQAPPGQLRGIGAAPEAIETNPALYDALYELPWGGEADPARWLDHWVEARYGRRPAPPQALRAWRALGASALDCPTGQQGASEAVVCARPSLGAGRVSEWGTCELFYDPDSVALAARLLLSLAGELSGPEYDHDLCDAARQALTDRALGLLRSAGQARGGGRRADYEQARDTFLSLILDLDRLLSLHPAFALGGWTEQARRAALGAGGGEAGADWAEGQARALITVWGPPTAAVALHDYSAREWGGLLRDFHYPRWERYFRALDDGVDIDDWYPIEAQWTADLARRYDPPPYPAPGAVPRLCAELLDKYLPAP